MRTQRGSIPAEAFGSTARGELEIESYSEPDLSWSHRAGGDEELIKEGLSLRGSRGGAKSVEVDELAAEAEHRCVEHVVEFHAPTQPHLLVEPELARDIQVENKLTRPGACISRQVS